MRDSYNHRNGPAEKIPLTRFLCFSLRTQVPAEAKILARRLTDMSQLVFAADAETTLAIPAEMQMQMLETLARFSELLLVHAPLVSLRQTLARLIWRNQEVARRDRH